MRTPTTSRFRRLVGSSSPSTHQWQSQQEDAPVTVDTRALIDKVLARYSGEFTVFRELLQNSDDAGCDAAEIRFETAGFLRLKPGAATKAGPLMLPDLKITDVSQWTFRNHGKPFTKQDWDRLPKIASGNPDPQKVGAFGVGFYSLFSVTESPYVSSGEKEMKFFWEDESRLFYRTRDLPQTDLWTTFKMPLREAAPMPPVLEFMQFLASSITFMVQLKDVTVFFNDCRVGQINKSLGQPQVIPIPTELKRSSPEKNMIVKSVQQYRKFSDLPITLRAKVMLPPCDSTRMHETKVDLVVFTAEVDVSVNEKLSRELNRCMRKNPPSRLKYSLIYTGKVEYDQSYINEQEHHHESLSPFRGLRADLDGATHTRVFIGHATAQTTGIGGHMASCFIPTVERECIDLVDRNVAIWNRELLYVGGFLCRAVYELELSKVQRLWEEAAAGTPQSPKLYDQYFLHLLKFFTIHRSTPSTKVAEWLAHSFYGCSTRPLRVLSSIGVREAPDVRAFDPVLAIFLKSLPMLSEDVTRNCAHFIAGLPARHKIRTITASDVLDYLRHHVLDAEELVACLRWWTTAGRNDSSSRTTDLLDVATFRGTCGTIRLASITYFIDPKVLGLHIPHDSPLPLSLIHLGVSKYFDPKELISFGWKEFTVALWLKHISRPDVMLAQEEYDFTRSVDWACLVLSTVCRIWPKLSEDIRGESREVVMNKPCIPTSKGLYSPECSYLPVADNALFHQLDLPIVGHHSRFEVDENMKEFLLFIGVRKNPPVQLLLNQVLTLGDWTALNLIDYLIKKESSMSSEDLTALVSSAIFVKENLQSNEENTRHRACDLYPPMDIFRELRLPVIEWSGMSEWRDASPEAQLLYRLDLNRFPPLPKIVELCSSSDNGLQETAFVYLCDNLHSQYLHYHPENFRDVEFIPAQSKGGARLRKLEEVYSCTRWKPLGFYVVPDRYQSAPLHQLGVMQHPPTSKLFDLLEKSPPRDEKAAIHWFEALFDHMASFSAPDLTKLSGLPIVPTGSPSALKFLPPTQCYLDQGTKPVLYAKLFVFVNFGTKANRFLGACGSKSKVSIEDVAEVLIDNPEKFFELAGGYEGFLVELRKLAYQIHDISNESLHKMSHSPALLGLRRKKTEGKAGWDYEHQFLTYQGVAVVDDNNDYQLFSDHLFIAPQEEALERFYASLGCRYLSEAVKERCSDLHEIPATKTCFEVQSLILERLPLFIQNYTDTKPKVTIPSSPDHLKVKACNRILVSKILVAGNVERIKDVRAIARSEGDTIELWISDVANCDMYEVATSLCRILFGVSKTNATVLLGTILSADLEFLERRGFLVDQISHQHTDTYEEGNKAMKRRSAGSPWTADSPQQSMLNTQRTPQLGCERLPGSFEASPQCPSLSHAADSVSWKIRETSNVFGDKFPDTIGHLTSLSLASCEVISQSYIRNIVEKAIEACRLEGKRLSVRSETSQYLSNTFCRMPADVRCFRPIGEVKNVQVCLDEGMPGAETFMERMHGPLSRFVDVIITLSEIYHISTSTLHVFYDVSGGRIAFNCGGIIYLNMRYFEIWHDEQVKNGNQQNAQMSWFLALAHEIAHNLTDQHNSDHEFWFSAICEAHLIAFSRLLRPANTWFRNVLWLALIVLVISFVLRAI
ncbi:hypothetical protein PISMIDRAFT_91498 [Pisolithus microcarpus 441]|uniref:Unplaced genomic scaffold scaffold_9, whole genome shotgun sequence n=1 Tax=Pisolithus microcarpus 441 TaxID=765257 RepID=A0A0D0A122_9AGAM|nr:hypothetical protein BKA83DRAFT_91498 [Pisolithus microcarpus]KIK28122.1 hypothetical protein PISMIDRAFT_91498 [Pisolithus microcarpus 441]